jgi:hypothetical protein
MAKKKERRKRQDDENWREEKMAQEDNEMKKFDDKIATGLPECVLYL